MVVAVAVLLPQTQLSNSLWGLEQALLRKDLLFCKNKTQ
jgi:hypothetical protein